MSKTLAIYNPVAGRGRAQKHWLEVEKELRAAGIEFDVAPTRGPRDATLIAQDAVGKYTTIVGVGGDGTIHEIVNGIVRAANGADTLALGVVPLGSGDDFAKMIPPITPIGGAAMNIKTAVAKIARGQTQLFDLGCIVGDGPRSEDSDAPFYFDNSMDVGFGAAVAQNFTTIPKFLTGIPAYFATIFKVMRFYSNPRLRIQLDDQPPIEKASTMTYVALGRCAAGTFWIAPDAQIDDGLFDVVIADAVGRMTILGLIPKILKGTHTHEPVLRITRAHRIVIDSPEPLVVESDGEIPFLAAHHLEVDILPRKLKMIV